jgi:hypothetical protein
MTNPARRTLTRQLAVALGAAVLTATVASACAGVSTEDAGKAKPTSSTTTTVAGGRKLK